MVYHIQMVMTPEKDTKLGHDRVMCIKAHRFVSMQLGTYFTDIQ